jgi:hypothetical protein
MKLIIIPSPMPDCWKAHGIETTAEPIIVFQQLKTMTMDEALPSFFTSKGFISKKRLLSIMCNGIWRKLSSAAGARCL